MTSSSALGAMQRGAPAEHGACYEALRRHALRRDSRPEARDGLAVLLREGVAGWMQAWSKVPILTERETPEEHPRAPLPDGVSAEVILVLAGMALGHLQEVR